jgi:hypothetical protein
MTRKMGNLRGQNGTLKESGTIITSTISWSALPRMSVGILRWRVNGRMINGVNRILGLVGEGQMYLMIVNMRG